MILKKLYTILLTFSSFFLFSQEMKEGFNFLETGKYQEAESFFEDILTNFPQNKTARLCYGRAIGLNGKATKAVLLFEKLLNDFPNDFEIQLNYAESLLWSKQFNKAKKYYEVLLKTNAKSFAALLGYANSLSNLKDYNKALTFVNKALIVSPGNTNALISKKYMKLGLASQKMQTRSYDTAEELLKENLQVFKNDKETLQNLANLYLISEQFDKAQKTYQTLGENPENKILSLNGIALANHLKGKEKEALKISKQSLASISTATTKELKKQTTERYIQALIWNKNYKKAEIEIEKLTQKNNNLENWVLALRATLNIYKSDFKKSVNDYNLILQKDSTSFDGNLGKANALKALGYTDDAYSSANNTLKFYNNQKDATNFIEQLNTSFTPFLKTKAAYSFDNGDNIAYSYTANTEVPLSTKFKFLANYNYRITSNEILNLKAIANNLLFGAAYQIKNNILFKGNIGLSTSESDVNNFSQLIADIALEIKPYKLQNLTLGYKRDIQNFNAELLNREIVQNNLIVNYNLSTNINWGWFTQYYYTFQSDDNTRNLLFTSVYYNILPKPSLKAGINYQYITFKNQVPTIYFSPSKFNTVELFVNLIKDEAIAKNKEWFYGLTAATGLQYIENNSSQNTYRIQTNLGYKFSKRAQLNIYGLQSNIASAVATGGSAGFKYTEVGLHFKWILLKKPIFKEHNN